MMNDKKMSKTDEWSLSFLLRADEFYIVTRFCYYAFLQYPAFRLAHHTLEYYLKSGLVYFMTLQQLKSIGHKLKALWKEYKHYISNLSLDDKVIEHIDHFENMRYPDWEKFFWTAWVLPYKDLFDNIISNVSEYSRDKLACFCMKEIDQVVFHLRSSIPQIGDFPIKVVGEEQERCLFHENKYFTKEENERKMSDK